MNSEYQTPVPIQTLFHVIAQKDSQSMYLDHWEITWNTHMKQNKRWQRRRRRRRLAIYVLFVFIIYVPINRCGHVEMWKQTVIMIIYNIMMETKSGDDCVDTFARLDLVI